MTSHPSLKGFGVIGLNIKFIFTNNIEHLIQYAYLS